MGKHGFFSFVGLFTGRLLLLANVVCIAWLWLCCAITWIPCDLFPRLSLLTLSFPLALLANVFFVALWILLKIKRVWIPLAGILVCWGYVQDYCPFRWKSSEQPAGIKILSWNTHGLGGAGNREKTMEYLKNSDADIICLQEVFSTGENWEPFLQEMAERGYEAETEHCQTIITKLHIIKSDTVVFETRSNRSNWYLLQHGADTILLVNNHLESIGFTAEMKKEYAEMIERHGLELDSDSGHSFLSLMVQAARYRGNQAKAVKRLVEEHPACRAIVCGDFNDTPISYPCQSLGRKMKSAFRDSGSGFAVSYNEKGFWVRIDHIFFSPEGKSHNTYIDSSIDVSDHYPIISWIDFAQNQQ